MTRRYYNSTLITEIMSVGTTLWMILDESLDWTLVDCSFIFLKVRFSQRSTGLICIYFILFVAWWMRSALGCGAKRVDMRHVGGYRAQRSGGGGVSSAWLAPVAAPSPPGAGTSSPSASPQSCHRAARLNSAEHHWSHSAAPTTTITTPQHWRLCLEGLTLWNHFPENPLCSLLRCSYLPLTSLSLLLISSFDQHHLKRFVHQLVDHIKI